MSDYCTGDTKKQILQNNNSDNHGHFLDIYSIGQVDTDWLFYPDELNASASTILVNGLPEFQFS